MLGCTRPTGKGCRLLKVCSWDVVTTDSWEYNPTHKWDHLTMSSSGENKL